MSESVVLRNIDSFLLSLDERPQFGFPKTFPLAQIEKILGKLFSLEHLQLAYQEKGWKKGADCFDGLGKQLVSLAIDWTPIKTPHYFLMDESDAKKMMQIIFGGESVARPFLDSDLTNGFCQYVALEILQAIEAFQVFAPFTPRLGDVKGVLKEELKEHSCFVIDITLTHSQSSFWGRLLIPATFREEWKQEISEIPLPPPSKEKLRHFPIDLACEVGSCEVTQNEWKALVPGDLLVLDKCHFFPDEQRGNVTLTSGETMLFRGKLKGTELKILELPTFDEVHAPMDNSFFDDDETEDEFLTDDDQFDEDNFENEAPEKEEPKGEFYNEGKKSDFSKLPINLTLELTRLQMNLEELMNLSPGNVLQIDSSHERGVDLVVNGKKMGRGEIVKLGDALGVRILSI